MERSPSETRTYDTYFYHGFRAPGLDLHSTFESPEKQGHGWETKTWRVGFNPFENYPSRSLPQGSGVKFYCKHLWNHLVFFGCVFSPLYTVLSTSSFQTTIIKVPWQNPGHSGCSSGKWRCLHLTYPENEPPKTNVEGDRNGVILQQTQRLFAKRAKYMRPTSTIQ